MKKEKIVVLGGGTGMSTLLRGLKQFPLDITAVVSVCDDGKSTGRLREEFHMPAVGDIRRVLVSLSEVEPLVEKLVNYRFKTTSDLNGHTVGNLLLTAMSNINGNMSDGIEALSKVFNLKGKVLPLTEDNVILMGTMTDGRTIEGEHKITQTKGNIAKVFYKEAPKINPKVLEEIREADLIIFSMGSLYTSIIPNLLGPELIQELDQCQAKLMYVSNMMTQPGETDSYTVSDHVKVINSYLGTHKIDVVLANDGMISEELVEKYSDLEQKDPVQLDRKTLEKMNVELITDNFVIVEPDSQYLRHNVVKLAFHIFSYLL
ncbi:MAG: YvcK family protein [Bacilli bacterium]|nr:YvcK family protein [Bacilli bacterium]